MSVGDTLDEIEHDENDIEWPRGKDYEKLRMVEALRYACQILQENGLDRETDHVAILLSAPH